MSHKTKEAALKAARKELGNEAIEGIDFVIKNTGAGYAHAEVPPANEAAAKAQEGRKTRSFAKELGEDGTRILKGAGPKAKSDTPNARAKRVKRELAKEKAATAPSRKPAPKVEPKPKAEGPNKTEQLIAMMKRPGGATSGEMEKAVGWQPHSVRGLLGTLRKKGVHIESRKVEKEPTYYTIKADAEATPGDVI
jgi:hypothetical protein